MQVSSRNGTSVSRPPMCICLQIAMAGPYARDEKDEAAHFQDGDGDATNVHGDGREAVHACKHSDNVDSAREGGVAAV